jgi:hypothetical protein
VGSLKSMQSNGYAEYVAKNQYQVEPNFGPAAPLQDSVNTNIIEVYKHIERLYIEQNRSQAPNSPIREGPSA